MYEGGLVLYDKIWCFNFEEKAIESPKNHETPRRWIISRFYKKKYVYLVLTSQVQARSSIVGNSASAEDQLFTSTFKALLNEAYYISLDICRYENVLEYTLSKVVSSVGKDIYMLPSYWNANIGKTVGYNNKVFISNTQGETSSSVAFSQLQGLSFK